MEHLPYPLLIKSTTDGQRLREQIRREREEDWRKAAEIIAKSKEVLKLADLILARVSRITPG